MSFRFCFVHQHIGLCAWELLEAYEQHEGQRMGNASCTSGTSPRALSALSRITLTTYDGPSRQPLEEYEV